MVQLKQYIQDQRGMISIVTFYLPGEERGACKCGKCECKKGHLGSNCGITDCSLENSRCLDNNGVCEISCSNIHLVLIFIVFFLKLFVHHGQSMHIIEINLVLIKVIIYAHNVYTPTVYTTEQNYQKVYSSQNL